VIYKLALISCEDFSDTKAIKELLGMFFPYHLLVSDKSKVAETARKQAQDYRCEITEIKSIDNELKYIKIKEHKPDIFLILWDGEDDDARFFIKRAHRDQIPTLIYYDK
jgi:hypothetical protein